MNKKYRNPKFVMLFSQNFPVFCLILSKKEHILDQICQNKIKNQPKTRVNARYTIATVYNKFVGLSRNLFEKTSSFFKNFCDFCPKITTFCPKWYIFFHEKSGFFAPKKLKLLEKNSNVFFSRIVLHSGVHFSHLEVDCKL